LWADSVEGAEITNPKMHIEVVLIGKLPGKAPGDTYITIVINDMTKNIPGCAHRLSARSSLMQMV
jgi:hypothetical protein